MKKIGIVTINDFNNYGNRIQCYAVQEILKKNGYEVENIYNIGLSQKEIIKRNIKKTVKYILNMKNQRELHKRRKYFNEFNKNIIFSKYKIKNGKCNAGINKLYDCFLVGSDQVWNPNFYSTSAADFLTFADDDKKVAFSASFGVNELPECKKEYYKNNLKSFKSISVREEAGKKILEDLEIDKKTEVLIDPTMLLDSDDWEKVSKKPAQYDGEKYILNYFLGNLTEKRKNEIENIAKEKKYKIINISDTNSSFYISGPSEFLWLEEHAELICTDSFHSSIFAMLFDKPFIIFNRDDDNISMNSRIETLISKFNLKDRKFNGKSISEENLKHDYTEAYKILEKEREKSLNFLNQALENY